MFFLGFQSVGLIVMGYHEHLNTQGDLFDSAFVMGLLLMVASKILNNITYSEIILRLNLVFNLTDLEIKSLERQPTSNQPCF